MGSSLLAVEGTLSGCNVRGLLSSYGRGDTLQFWWVGSSFIVANGFSLIVAQASSQIQKGFWGSSLIAGCLILGFSVGWVFTLLVVWGLLTVFRGVAPL